MVSTFRWADMFDEDVLPNDSIETMWPIPREAADDTDTSLSSNISDLQEQQQNENESQESLERSPPNQMHENIFGEALLRKGPSDMLWQIPSQENPTQEDSDTKPQKNACHEAIQKFSPAACLQTGKPSRSQRRRHNRRQAVLRKKYASPVDSDANTPFSDASSEHCFSSYDSPSDTDRTTPAPPPSPSDSSSVKSWDDQNLPPVDRRKVRRQCELNRNFGFFSEKVQQAWARRPLKDLAPYTTIPYKLSRNIWNGMSLLKGRTTFFYEVAGPGALHYHLAAGCQIGLQFQLEPERMNFIGPFALAARKPHSTVLAEIKQCLHSLDCPSPCEYNCPPYIQELQELTQSVHRFAKHGFVIWVVQAQMCLRFRVGLPITIMDFNHLCKYIGGVGHPLCFRLDVIKGTWQTMVYKPLAFAFLHFDVHLLNLLPVPPQSLLQVDRI